MREDTSVLGLATIRKNRGIQLEQIADATKISIRFLKAIEAGEFEKLPGGVYNVNYLRQYARAIDFSEADLLAYYQQKTGQDVGTGSPPANDSSGGKGFFGTIRSAVAALGF